jgi:hypothetical protein
MKKVVTAHVGADGVLTLTLPLGETVANRTVRILVELIEGEGESKLSIRTQEEWLQFIAATAGKWQGELERPPQGEYEQRDKWP